MIMHTIIAKEDHQDHASVDYENSLIELDDEVLRIIRKRLTEAAGRHSKSFELEIENTQEGEFFSICSQLKNHTEPEFISATKDIADLLALGQTNTSWPGGFLIILDCVDDVLQTSIYVVIKAEPHEALQRIDGQSQIALLKKVFLSPTQKLYKIGILYEKENPASDAVNDAYGCFLFDDQFRTISHPAEYFYKVFLGFSIGNNAKIQSQKFFNKTESFILNEVQDLERKTELLNALRIEFTVNQEATITPNNFAHTYFAEVGLRDQYITGVVHQLPATIVKDQVLIKNKLTKRKVGFPNNIKITGPNDGFDDSVQFINEDDLGELDLNSDNYTLVKIIGKPFEE